MPESKTNLDTYDVAGLQVDVQITHSPDPYIKKVTFICDRFGIEFEAEDYEKGCDRIRAEIAKCLSLETKDVKKIPITKGINSGRYGI